MMADKVRRELWTPKARARLHDKDDRVLLMVLRSWDTPAGISALAEYMDTVRGQLASIPALAVRLLTAKNLTAVLNTAHEQFQAVQCGLDWARDLAAYLVKAAGCDGGGGQVPHHQVILLNELKLQSGKLEAPSAPTLGFFAFIGRTNTVRYWVCSCLERVAEFAVSMHNLRATEKATSDALAEAPKVIAKQAAATAASAAAAATAALDEALQVHAYAKDRSLAAAQYHTLHAQQIAAIPGMSLNVFAVEALHLFAATAVREAAAERAVAGMVDTARCHHEAAMRAAAVAAAAVIDAAATVPNTLPKTYPTRQLTVSHAACTNVSSYTVKALLGNRTVNAK
jgi:hypothetical protein